MSGTNILVGFNTGFILAGVILIIGGIIAVLSKR